MPLHTRKIKEKLPLHSLNNTTMYKLKIKVTKEHIENAKMCGADPNLKGHNKGLYMVQNCAVALAIRDIFPKAMVTSLKLYPFGKHALITEEMNMFLPSRAQIFIHLFDKLTPEERIEKLPEIEFTIRVPQSVIDKINIDSLKEHETLELIEH